MTPESSAGINFAAVIAGAVAYMALGALWYSPALFGRAWMRGIGKTAEQVKADFKAISYLWAFIMSFLAVYGIARIMRWSGGDTIRDGIMIALVAGVCFVLATFVTNDRFEGRRGGLTVVNALYHVTGLLLAGVIVGAWR